MSLTHAQFQEWLDRYVAAWKSYDPKEIGDLFAKEVQYRHHPNDDAICGRDAVVADWLENPDEAGAYDAKYEPMAIEGENHVARGWTRDLNPDGTTRDEYWNVYLVTFDGAGRATSFTEWWIQTRGFFKADMERIKLGAKAELKPASRRRGR